MEEKWFEMYTWNGERETEKIFIALRKGLSYDIMKGAVEPYLESINLKKEPGKVKLQTRFYRGWSIDLVEKTFTPVKFPRHDEAKAWPSQISEFTAKHYGTLVGKKFGI